MEMTKTLRLLSSLIIFISSITATGLAINSEFNPEMKSIDKFSCYVKFHSNIRQRGFISRFDKFIERKMEHNNEGSYYYKGYFTKTLNLRDKNGFYGVGKLGYEFYVDDKGETPKAYFRICSSGSFEYKGERVIKHCRKNGKFYKNTDDIESILSQKWTTTRFLSGQPVFNASMLKPVSVFSKNRYLEPMFSFYCRFVNTTVRP